MLQETNSVKIHIKKLKGVAVFCEKKMFFKDNLCLQKLN